MCVKFVGKVRWTSAAQFSFPLPSLAGEDKGEGTYLTNGCVNPRRNASVRDDEPSPAPSPAGIAGEGQDRFSLHHPQI